MYFHIQFYLIFEKAPNEEDFDLKLKGQPKIDCIKLDYFSNCK